MYINVIIIINIIITMSIKDILPIDQLQWNNKVFNRESRSRPPIVIIIIIIIMS